MSLSGLNFLKIQEKKEGKKHQTDKSLNKNLEKRESNQTANFPDPVDGDNLDEFPPIKRIDTKNFARQNN